MAAYVAYDPEAEVNGEAILSSVEGTGPLREMALKILKDNGIEPKPGKWYKQQAWLDSFRAIGQMAGDPVLRMIGRTIPESALPRFYVSTSKSIIKALINMRSFEIQLSPIG